MGRLLRRVWKYVTALFTGKFNEMADPRIQLEQAIQEAQEQHRELKEQAANVIANEKQTESRLQRARDKHAKLSASAEQALVMQSESLASGDDEKAAEYARAAENIATRMIGAEEEIDDLEQLLKQSLEATRKAKDAVNRNGQILQQKIAEQQQLLSKLDQAKMQEQVNGAMASLTEGAGAQDTPTFDEVRAKIERRSAQAAGTAELQESSVEGRMMEVEQAVTNTQAQTRLSEMRSKLGIASAPGTASAPGAASADTAQSQPAGSQDAAEGEDTSVGQARPSTGTGDG